MRSVPTTANSTYCRYEESANNCQFNLLWIGGVCQQLPIQHMIDRRSVPTTANSTYCKHSTLQHCLRQVLYPIGLTEHSNIMLFSSTEFYFKQWSGVCYEVDCFFTDKKYNVICI